MGTATNGDGRTNGDGVFGIKPINSVPIGRRPHWSPSPLVFGQAFSRTRHIWEKCAVVSLINFLQYNK